MAVTPDDLRAYAAPVFDDETVWPDVRLQGYLQDAALFISRDAWGSRYDVGVRSFALHLATLDRLAAAGTSSGGGPGLPTRQLKSVTQETLSVEWESSGGASPAYGTDAWFGLTSYGSQYLIFRSLIFASRVVPLVIP